MKKAATTDTASSLAEPHPSLVADPPALALEPEDQELLNEAAAHYHRALLVAPEVLTGLRWRGQVERELVEHFHLGYADRTLEATLAPKGATRLARLKALGLICRSGRERFGGAVVVPIRDAAGNTLQMCGAYHVSTHRHTPEEYLPGPRRGVFHPLGFEHGEELILTRSPLDAMRFWYAGHTNVTWADGVVLRDELLRAMKRHGTQRVLIAYDLAADGDQAALEVAEKLKREAIAAYRLRLVRRFKPTSQKWGELVKGAVPLLGAAPRPELAPLPPDWRRLTNIPPKERRAPMRPLQPHEAVLEQPAGRKRGRQ